MPVCDIVVVGSYPPMPGPATAATLGAVRRAWDDGSVVAMVSYRTGAAPLAVPVSGLLAGWRLEQVRRAFGGPAQVCLGVQRDAPFSDRRFWAQRVTAVGLAVALRRFAQVTVVLGEDPVLSRSALRYLAGAVDHWSASTEEVAGRLVQRYKVPAGAVSVDRVTPFPATAAGGPPPVGPGHPGLYDPSAREGLVFVELPTTTTAQRVRARLQRLKPGFVRRFRRR